jgi:hypothetical protein
MPDHHTLMGRKKETKGEEGLRLLGESRLNVEKLNREREEDRIAEEERERKRKEKERPADEWDAFMPFKAKDSLDGFSPDENTVVGGEVGDEDDLDDGGEETAGEE